MTFSGTQTRTFTVADIRKVVDCFAADLSMKAQATGLMTRERVAEFVSDLKILAETGFLVDVKLILKDVYGVQTRATIYKVSESASGWSNDRPGNNMWPRTPDGSLRIIAGLNQAWWDKTDHQKKTFVFDHGLHSSWDRTTEDTSFAGLARSAGQRYSSNGYGWERTNFG